MKTAKHILPSLLTALVISAATPTFAGEDVQQKHEARMQEHLDNMKKELNLSDDQASQIKALQKSHMEKRKADREAMRKEMDAILTPEQRKKAEEMRKARKAKFMERHGDHGEE